MDLPALGARLASSSVIPLVKKLFVAQGPGAGLVDRPVRLSVLVSFQGEKRTLSEKEFRKLAEQLVERASQSTGVHEQLPAYELRAVTNAILHSLRGLGDLDMDDVQAVRLGHRELALRIRSQSGQATNGLSSDAVLLHASVLDTVCLHILHFFTQRSTFVARTLVEQSHQLNELTAKIDELVARTPSPADATFEERYAGYVTQKHSELTILGLDLTESPDRWPLDAAYLNLTASSNSSHTPSQHLPAEQALGACNRVLLRGVAGSGKTTLVQWLAVSAARRTVNERLLYLHDLVPFVLPLRTLTRKGAALPTPDEFLSAIRCPLSGAQPTGWLDRILTSGRGILLIDGIDEVPKNEREASRAWLRELVSSFPKNRWLVTSRPSAVREEWLSTEGFTEFDLAPMSRDDVSSFIQRWHSAAGIGDTYARTLLRTVWAKQDLARLATNPLMCGLICALHRDRRGYLPDGRKELYDAALSMLLSRRDRERGIESDGAIRIAEPHQIQLLQKLAYWLIRNGRSEMDAAYATELLGVALPAMPQVGEQGNGDDVYRHLLVRSGVLREPSVGSVDFIHRSFQDYLGAKAAVEELDFDLLAQNAHLDQWEDVVRMAVAHARPKERANLIEALISRGDTDENTGRRLHLLAAACMEHATELDPTIRREVEKRAAALVPPKSIEQARALASVGPFVLELLPGPEGTTHDEGYFTALTAIEVGGDAAIPILARYRNTRDWRIRHELARAWNRFDADRFTEEIICHLDEHDFYFPISNRAELLALQNYGGRSHIEITGDVPLEEVAEFCNASRLTHLWVSVDVGDNFQWLARFHNLHTIVLGSDLSGVDVSSLGQVPSLHTLYITAGSGVIGSNLLPPHIQVLHVEAGDLTPPREDAPEPRTGKASN